MRIFFSLGILIAAIISLHGCKSQPAGGGAATSSDPALADYATNPGRVIAKIDGQTITEADIAQKIQNDLHFEYEKIYQLKKRAIEEVVDEKLLKAKADEQKKTPEAFIDEMTKSQTAVSDQEVDDFYQRVKDNPRLQGSEDEKKAKVREYLVERKKASLETKLYEDLRKDHKLELAIQPPPYPTVNVAIAATDPFVGPANAKVTVVEFSDFECPFCARMAETLEKLSAEYKDKVKFVFKDFPLPMHPNAETASLAAACAHEMGKYWDYHKALFANNRALEKDKLISYAEGLGLDGKAFKECLDSAKHKAQIDEDKKEGQRIGISSTPTIIVNNKLITGAKTYQALKELIDADLK